MQSKPPPPLYNLVQISDAKQATTTSLPGTDSLLTHSSNPQPPPATKNSHCLSPMQLMKHQANTSSNDDEANKNSMGCT
ncbi:hypothetical protein NC651_024416 [Populus alba x Populus x berolinensis]|nr:hypothetical protein NC651_024416 [Populus alba x Populus x berolinensis]